MPIVNLDEVRRGHDHFLAGHERMVANAQDVAGRHALSHVAQHADFKRRTGNLQDKTKFRIIRGAGGRLLRLSNNTKYAGIIEYGSKPHWIYPKQRFSGGRVTRGQFLAFRGRNGQMVFRRRVFHPGTRPYKFLYNATDSAYRVLGHELDRGMSDLARRF